MLIKIKSSTDLDITKQEEMLMKKQGDLLLGLSIFMSLSYLVLLSFIATSLLLFIKGDSIILMKAILLFIGMLTLFISINVFQPVKEYFFKFNPLVKKFFNKKILFEKEVEIADVIHNVKIKKDLTEEYYVNNRLHREELKPAIIEYQERKYLVMGSHVLSEEMKYKGRYFVNGIEYTFEELNKFLNIKEFIKSKKIQDF